MSGPDTYLDAKMMRSYLRISTVQQFDRWCRKWGLEAVSPPGKRPRVYRTSDFLDAYRKWEASDTPSAGLERATTM